MRNVHFKISLFIVVISLTCAGMVFAAQAPQTPQQPNQTATQPDPNAASNTTAVNSLIDKIVGREAVLGTKMRGLHPIVETYLQSLSKDETLTFKPAGDRYFLGKLDF